ncbi:MAG: hypothetical protein ACK5JE_08250 [Castellaniella sp.]|uniref:hypothetical protein n=1 Tax=Castellaniella sp. TaxID=1955812 RepID=UPI003A84177A
MRQHDNGGKTHFLVRLTGALLAIISAALMIGGINLMTLGGARGITVSRDCSFCFRHG